MTFGTYNALPRDVPAEVLPVAMPFEWRATVAAAGYRCECTGRCERSHRKSGGRCDKSMQSLAAVRLYALPAVPGSKELVALCDRCADGYRTADRRLEIAAAARRASQAPSLLDLLTTGED